MRAAVLALMTACGRIDFDADPAELEVELHVVAGASSIDVEQCATHFANIAHVVSTVAWPADWDRAYFDAQVAAQPAEIVGTYTGELTHSGCTTTTHHFDREMDLHVYGVADADPDAAVASLDTTLAPMLEPNMYVAAWPQYYYLHHPESWFRDPTTPMPVLIFLAGQGEQGDDAGSGFDTMANRGLLQPYNRFNAAVVDRPFLVVAPQCNATRGGCNGWDGQMEILDEVLDRVLATEAVDRSRVYITGLSTGGEGVYRYAVHAEGRAGVKIAAAVPASSTMIDPQWLTDNLCAMRDVPVWAFHNGDDATQPVTNSRTYVATLAACPSRVTPQLDEGTGGHNAWVPAYSDMHTFVNAGEHSIYSWMLRFTR